jgi:hypothetical protein
VSSLLRSALGAALKRVHPCTNNTCALAAALRAKLYFHAAYLTTRASEGLLAEGDPEGILDKFQALCPALGEDPEAIAESVRFCEIPTVECPACGADVFLDLGDPKKCDHCGVGETETLLGKVIDMIARDIIQHHGGQE